MTGRSVPEWRGKTPDSKVPPHVRTRIFERCGGVCHISRRVIRAGEPWQLEHVKALSLGGEHAEFNLAPALVAPHKEKSAVEAGVRAKADRIKLKHLGQWSTPYTGKLKSRGFQQAQRTARHPNSSESETP